MRIGTVIRTSFAALVGVLVVLTPTPVSAHTDVDFTVPADGETVLEPVAVVTVAFADPVELVGNGFEVMDPQGNLFQPKLGATDGTVFELLFDPPLAGGDAGVRYEVRSADGHVNRGSFSFTIDAPAATSAPEVTAPVTTAVATAPEASVPATTAVATTPPAPATISSTTSPKASTGAGTSSEATVATTAAPSASSDDAADGGGGMALPITLGGVAVAGAIGFLVVRSRSGAPA